MAESSGGTVFRGSDGSVYFIRDSLLDACKVQGEYLEPLEQILAEQSDEVSGYSFEGVDIEPVGRIDG